MTVRVSSLVWDSTVRAPERFTLLALADRADEDGYCFPSIAYLARKCMTSDRSIQRHITTLEEMDLLKVDRPADKEARRSSRYHINLSLLRQMIHPDNVPAETPHPRQSVTGDNLTPVTDCPPTGDNLSADRCQSDTLSVRDPKEDPREGRASAPAPTRGTRIPDDFAVTEAMRAWARKNTPLVGKVETEQFIDYWRSETGAKASKRDWVLAWQVWMRREQKSTEQRNARGPLRSVPKPPAEYRTFNEIHEAADVDFARRLMTPTANYLMPDRPLDSPMSHAEWRTHAAREWITRHEAPIRAALERRNSA